MLCSLFAGGSEQRRIKNGQLAEKPELGRVANGQRKAKKKRGKKRVRYIHTRRTLFLCTTMSSPTTIYNVHIDIELQN